MLNKKLLVPLFAILLITTVSALATADYVNNEIDNEQYYQAVTQLVSSHWDDSYFDTITLSIGGDTLEVDNRLIKLNNTVEILNGEPMLPAEVLEALGAQVYADLDGVSIIRKGMNIVIRFGENNIEANGEKKATLKNGTPILPACILRELSRGFEIVYYQETGEITITNEFQMARLVVKVKPGKAAPDNIAALQAIAGPDGLYVYQFATEDEAQAACELLNANPDVLYAEPDRLVTLNAEQAFSLEEFAPAAAYSHLGWGPGRLGSDLYLDYLAASGKQNAAVTVAVLDTGLDAAHPYFAGRHVPGRNFIVTGATPNDVHSHGTHVSGTIVDVTIALPNVKIMPVKVLGDDGRGTSISVANGIRWAADNGAQAINMSLGGGHTQDEDDAVNYAVGKNITVVVAAGNDAEDAKNHCPAHIDTAVTVSAFDNADKPAYFTNYGLCVDVAAPGVSIVSTVPGGGTGSKSGTSMASPHVAGAAALLLCDNPALSPAAVKSLLRHNVDPITLSGNNTYYGSGILNIGKAAIATAPQFILAKPGGVVENIYSGPQQQQLAIEYYDNGTISNVTSQATFLSGSAAIATVSNSGLVTVSGLGRTNITVGYNGKSTTVPVVGESVAPLTVLSSVPADGSTNIYVGTTITVAFSHRIQGPLTYTLRGPDGRNIGWSQQLVGTSVTVTLNERLMPFSEYTFTIPVGGANYSHGKLEQNFTMKFTTGEDTTITPILVTSVTLPATATVTANGTTTLTATVLPANATNKVLEWSSSNTAAATVNTSGVVSGVAAGTATITARSTDGSNRTGSCTVTVTATPTGVTVTPDMATVNVNATCQLTATVTPANAINTITWSSNNTAVATVSTTGLVTARAAGTATITAKTVNGLTADCVITVPDTIPPVITLLGGSTVTIKRGNPFVEPGYQAIDNVDGDITHKVVITGSVDTNVIGVYRLDYTVSDAAGNTGTATRIVNVTPNQLNFSFSNKGKAGESFSNNFALTFPGTATITVPGLDNKTSLTVSIKNSAGTTVFSSSFSQNTSKSVDLVAGNYTATTRIDSTNGNTTVTVSIAIAESESPPSTAPTVTLIGSSQIVLHLGGSPYVEQGVQATDTVDGDLSEQAVIISDVNTSKAGNYTVRYTVTNSAGLSTSVTRRVEIVAPETRTTPGRTYSFAPKGKQGESFAYSADVAVTGTASLTVSVPNKTTITVTVANSLGTVVLNETFTANATRSFQAIAGSYSIKVSIDVANGNTTVNLGLTTPGGIETYFPKPEITR
jgi:subtilisin family serine protease/uncharacterized protein YjdB